MAATEINTPALLADLAERYWRFECHEIPLSAALAGQATNDAVLFRESAADHARRDFGAGALLAEVDAIDASGLDAQGRATHALLRRELMGQARKRLGAAVAPKEIDFVDSARQGDIIELGIVATAFGRTSITLRCEVRNLFTRARILTIERIVFVNVGDDGRPEPHGFDSITYDRDRVPPRASPAS